MPPKWVRAVPENEVNHSQLSCEVVCVASHPTVTITRFVVLISEEVCMSSVLVFLGKT